MFWIAWNVGYPAAVAVIAVAYLTHTRWLILPLVLLALANSALWLWHAHCPDAPAGFHPATRRLRALTIIPLAFLTGVVAAVLQHASLAPRWCRRRRRPPVCRAARKIERTNE